MSSPGQQCRHAHAPPHNSNASADVFSPRIPGNIQSIRMYSLQQYSELCCGRCSKSPEALSSKSFEVFIPKAPKTSAEKASEDVSEAPDGARREYFRRRVCALRCVLCAWVCAGVQADTGAPRCSAGWHLCSPPIAATQGDAQGGIGCTGRSQARGYASTSGPCGWLPACPRG